MGQDAKLEHRLAAILATDVVGYSQSMQSDEAGTLVALAAIREATENQVDQHRGRIANTAGDSVLAEFGSALDAVSCAVAIQQELAKDKDKHELRLRIGVHIGDVVVKNGDLFGTAVNVASRLEGIAEAGGVVISAAVRDAVVGRLLASFTDLGPRALKNIEEPLRAYALGPSPVDISPGASRLERVLPLPNKPSIAVLAFEDLSGDRDQEYFADGMVEEIITALSRMRWLFVIARNSSFAYKGRAVDVKQIGRELGVRYLLEGSVRKSGSRLRITGQLIDTTTGAHLWAERFDGAVEDLFHLQDQVTASVVGAISPKLVQAEIERSARKPTSNLDAYDHYLRGLAGVHQWTKEGNDQALYNLYRAIELDPNFAAAYGLASRTYVQRRSGGWVTDLQNAVAEAERLARKAVDLGKDDAVALATAGFALFDLVEDMDSGDALINQALNLNPNLAWAWVFSCWTKGALGEPEVAVEHGTRAVRLSPNDPQRFSVYCALAQAHFFAGRYDQAIAFTQVAERDHPKYLLGRCIGAASAARAGRSADALKAMVAVRQLDPTLRISNLRNLQPIRRPEDYARWEEGLRLSGLPE